MTKRGPDDGLASLIFWTSLAAGAALRIWLAFTDDGIYWPDEIYQTLEPAHRVAFGYGRLAWEWVEGVRSWILPGVLAGVMTLCHWMGFGEPRVYLIVIRLIFVACSVGCGWATYRLAQSYGARPFAAAVGAAVTLLFAPAIYFSNRALFETAAALPAAVGFAFAVDRSAGRWKTIGGAALVGLAAVLRMQTGPIAIVLLCILVARRRFARAAEATAAFTACALVYGVVDRLTWASLPGAYLGGWFHSAIAYVNFSLIEGKASQWGTSPWSYYFVTLFHLAPVLSVAAVCVALLSIRSAAGLWAATLFFLGAHAAIPHKELRFILPALPFIGALVATGLDRLSVAWSRVAAVVLLLAVSVSAARFHTLTFEDLGADPKQGDSAYDNAGPRNRLLLVAHDQPRLCGVAVEAPLVWTGVYAYLHRRAPLYEFHHKDIERLIFNYVIVLDDTQVQGTIVARDGRWVLRDLGFFPCLREPYSWRN